MKKSVMTFFASCMMVSSVVGFNYDANIGYFPVARQSGGIYQVDARVLTAVPYGNVFGGLGLLGSNRNNSFDLWVSGAAGFQFDSIDAIKVVSIKPEVSVVVNGYTNSNAALALGALVTMPYQTTGLTGGFIRWSLNGDVLVGLNFSQPFGGGDATCRMAGCKKESGKTCQSSDWSCHKRAVGVASTEAVSTSSSPSASTDESPSSSESGATRLVLATKTETVSFQDIKGIKGEAAIIALTRVGLFSDSKRFLPTKKPSLAEYNAVMGRLVKALGLPDREAAKEVPNKSQVVVALRDLLTVATKSYSDADAIATQLAATPAVKKREPALSREALAVVIDEHLRLVPGLLGDK